jgi:hypothetical protein
MEIKAVVAKPEVQSDFRALRRLRIADPQLYAGNVRREPRGRLAR